MISYQYRKSHCGDKTILRPSYLHNGIAIPVRWRSLYWIRALLICITTDLAISMTIVTPMFQMHSLFPSIDHAKCFLSLPFQHTPTVHFGKLHAVKREKTMHIKFHVIVKSLTNSKMVEWKFWKLICVGPSISKVLPCLPLSPVFHVIYHK